MKRFWLCLMSLALLAMGVGIWLSSAKWGPASSSEAHPDSQPTAPPILTAPATTGPMLPDVVPKAAPDAAATDVPESLRVRGAVLDSEGDGVPATVSVYGGFGQVPLGRVRTDSEGIFDDSIPAPDAPSGGFLLVAVSDDGAFTSFPLAVARSAQGLEGVLFLRDGCRVQAHCENRGEVCEFLLIERPTLPADRQLRQEDLADTVTVARVVSGTEAGLLSTVCRACELEVRARIGGSAWGPPVSQSIRVDARLVDLGQVPLPQTTSELTIRVVDEAGNAVPRALVLASRTVPFRAVPHFVPSFEGVEPDSDGFVRVPKIGDHEFPLTIAAASVQHYHASRTLAAAPSAGEVVQLVLESLPHRDVAIEVEGGGDRVLESVTWHANPQEDVSVDLGDPGSDPIKLLAVRFHKHCEAQALPSGIHRLHFRRPGAYSLQGTISAGVTVSTQLQVWGDSTDDVQVIEVPHGRPVAVRMSSEAREQALAMRTESVTISWRGPRGNCSHQVPVASDASSCWIPSTWVDPKVQPHPRLGWPEVEVPLSVIHRRTAPDQEELIIPGVASGRGYLLLSTVHGERARPGCEIQVQSVRGSYMRTIPITVRTPATLLLPEGEYSCQVLVGGLPRGTAQRVHVSAGAKTESVLTVGDS